MFFDLKKQVIKEVNSLFPFQKEMVRVVLQSERFGFFLGQLQKEIIAEDIRNGVKFQKPQLERLVKGATQLYVGLLLRKLEEEAISNAEKKRRESEIRTEEIVKSELGELGVTIEDNQGRSAEAGATDYRIEGSRVVKS